MTTVKKTVATQPPARKEPARRRRTSKALGQAVAANSFDLATEQTAASSAASQAGGWGASGALERARHHWLTGQWEALAELSATGLDREPQRAMLAAFSAVGLQHLGDAVGARRLVRLAVDWGCAPDMLSRLLVAGVHRTLARARAVQGRPDVARKHIESALGGTSRLTGVSPGPGPGPKASAGQLRGGDLAGPWSREFADLPLAREPMADVHPFDLPAVPRVAAIPDAIRGQFVDCAAVDAAEDWRLAEKGQYQLGGRRLEVKRYPWGSDQAFHIALRPKSGGDLGTARQILADRDYDFEWLPQGRSLRALYSQHVAQGRAPLILDAGANIGVSPLFWLFRYPSAQIFAIEPDRDNCELLRLNCRGRDVLLFPGALAGGVGELSLVDPGEGDWGFRAEEQGGERISTLGVAEILADWSVATHPPLIVKIDIEGGEKRVFDDGAPWLAHTPMLIIELHDWMLPGESTSAGFRRVIAQHDFELVLRGENLLCFNRRLLSNF